MRKAVSSKEGYTLFFEQKKEDVKCTAYITGDHMTGQEIADILNISRSAVSMSIKRSMERIYNTLKYRCGCSPVETICLMANMFNIHSEKQYNKFFKLFPPEIKGEVRYEAFKTA